jgi:hypothetical protein
MLQLEVDCTIVAGEHAGQVRRCWLPIENEDGFVITLDALDVLGFETDDLEIEQMPQVAKDLSDDKPYARIKLQTNAESGFQGVRFQRALDPSDVEDELSTGGAGEDIELEVGATVECEWDDGETYRGEVTEIDEANETATVAFEDGPAEVALKELTVVQEEEDEAEEEADVPHVGQTVTVEDDGTTYTGEITGVEVESKTADVDFGEYGEEIRPWEDLKLASDADEEWEVGETILAPWGTDGEMYEAKVLKVDGNSLLIRYEDGEEDEAMADTCKRNPNPDDGEDEEEETEPRKGDVVLFDHKGGEVQGMVNTVNTKKKTVQVKSGKGTFTKDWSDVEVQVDS